MRQIHRTPQSLLDVQNIWNYVAERNVPAANKLLKEFDARLKLLLQFPQSGIAINDVWLGLRVASVQRYLLFYREIAEGIVLIRVLHSARHWEVLLGETHET